MRTFLVYWHPHKGYKAVKIGFSWPAFFFGFIWMLSKSMWMAAFWTILAWIAILAVDVSILNEIINFSLGLVVATVIGFRGNEWWRNHLIVKGFSPLNEIEEVDPFHAIKRTIMLTSNDEQQSES